MVGRGFLLWSANAHFRICRFGVVAGLARLPVCALVGRWRYLRPPVFGVHALIAQARLRRSRLTSSREPVTDYLADRGRTRVLEYRLPAEARSIADLCGAVLATVYQVAPADEVLISNE